MCLHVVLSAAVQKSLHAMSRILHISLGLSSDRYLSRQAGELGTSAIEISSYFMLQKWGKCFKEKVHWNLYDDTFGENSVKRRVIMKQRPRCWRRTVANYRSWLLVANVLHYLAVAPGI